ncbi:hypothetical protein KR093_002809 [Drosophila rubida]|uniref:tRNA/rRNA methyltransferase SpoU type domain-containing protein n=1 Tax=Drosophila rubida TaxID=30044 RepID=A0AAD4PTB3_9MUSC|nr:hypothetical protein KR093_002809 [Drosophila rubida]
MALPSTKATTATTTHAVVQAIETYIQNQNLLGEIAELDELLNDLIDLHKDNELALKRVVQCIYNLLQSNSKYNVKFGAKVFHKLVSIVIADNMSFCRQLVANVLICVQIYARKFPRIDGKFLMQQLWSLSLSSECQPHAAQILVQLFDDFVRQLGAESICCIELQLVIKSLLQSEAREFRKAAYFLMRKLENVNRSVNEIDDLPCTRQQWTSYVTIMESLEEQQSHLMLPTLGTLIPRIICRTAHEDLEWISWLRILYVRLLQDNNILVLRWTLEYFVTHFDVIQLRQVDLLPEFLAATNRTQLYNVECYFVPTFKFNNFMAQEQMQVFLEALVTIPWHSVPLLFWLQRMPTQNDSSTSKTLLLKLSSRVRSLRNTRLRRIANKRVFKIFETTINSLTLRDYLTFIETIFNVNDGYYNDYERFILKLRNCKNIDEDVAYFSKRSFEIIVDDSHDNLLVPELIRHFNGQPKKLHGWWRLFPLFIVGRLDSSAQQMCWDFYSSQYDVKREILKKGSNIAMVQEHLICQLDCQTKEEKSFVNAKSVDWFVETNLERWSQIYELHLKPLELLERGTRTTFMCLAQLLRDSETPVEENESVLQALLGLLHRHKNSECAVAAILKYATQNMSDVDTEKLAETILSHRGENTIKILLSNVKTLGVSFIVQGILHGDITSGDARIEAAYADSIVDKSADEIVLRNEYIYFAMQQSDEEVNAISAQLQLANKQLTEKKPRYFENCKEHRLKIRIARALLMMQSRISWSDELWNTLLSPCDQLNISYMYECLVASLLPSLQFLLDRIQQIDKLKPSQQVSIISVIHLYCMHNWNKVKTKDLEKIVSLLLPHTMGAHFQTRLLAQLVLHKMAAKCKQTGIVLPILEALQSGIEMTLGSRLAKFEYETRIVLSDVMVQPDSSADLILYMTNAPFDEYDKIRILPMANGNIDAYRKVSITKKNPLTATHDLQVEMNNLNVQRKANPVKDIFNTNENITKQTKPAQQDLIVVASLIDKLPNLGGLARTCEVLGVKTLILNSKSVVDKTDFTNLSMTAEKSLNILEVKPDSLAGYLINKQSMGYKIVGAEQTAYSISFVDFKFPEKCVLLLGHEKHGISVDLIALLDFAVEIPQFGMVRSLNVHVTGSLFIWEYCKQHLNN